MAFTERPQLAPEQLAALRQDYSQRGLRRVDLEQDPIVQFQGWLDEAARTQILEPNGMTLATVDAAGQPWTRTVLLKVCDSRGFTFFTNYTGAKGAQLLASPRAALTFWWGALERQVNITGIVEKTSAAESDAYFASRPEASRLGAWASQQSSILAGRDQLEAQYEETRQRFSDGEIPRPANWGGYRLLPETIEFWQGRRSRLHDRFRYTRMGNTWKIDRLSP